MTRMSSRLLRGVVSEFDEPRGLGVLEAQDGERFVFHCTALADGSRTVDAGSEVVFMTAPGHLGRVEASQIFVVFGSSTSAT